MNHLSLRRTFVLFHCTLGTVVFIESVRTGLQAASRHPENPLGEHLVILAALEALAAILFLIPSTLKAGSWMLLAIFALAIVLHGPANELVLFVYAVGVIFVNVHGSAYGRDLLLPG